MANPSGNPDGTKEKSGDFVPMSSALANTWRCALDVRFRRDLTRVVVSHALSLESGVLWPERHARISMHHVQSARPRLVQPAKSRRASPRIKSVTGNRRTARDNQAWFLAVEISAMGLPALKLIASTTKKAITKSM
jgi:hypothetical protein